MRRPDTGRAAHSKVRTSTLRFWPMDDGSFADFIGSANLTNFGTPAPSTVSSPQGSAAEITGTAGLTAAASAGDISAANGECTIRAWVRLRAIPSGVYETIVALAGDITQETSTENVLLLVGVDANQNIIVAWENGAGVDVSVTTTNYVLPLNVWTQIAVRKKNLSGSNIDVDVIVNGHTVETFAGETNSDGGANADWYVGCVNSGASAARIITADIDEVILDNVAVSDADLFSDVRRHGLFGHMTRVDVSVKTEAQGGGTVELTNLEGRDWVRSVEIADDIEDGARRATIRLVREFGNLSLAGLKEDSKINLTNVLDPTSYAPLLDFTKEIEIFLARVPLFCDATASDWVSYLDGEIITPDDGQGDAVVLQCQDNSAKLLRAIIEDEYAYSDPSTAEPSEDIIQEVLDDNDNAVNGTYSRAARTGGYAPITLHVPVDPGADYLEFAQRRESVWAAIRTLAALIGWDCRYRFDQNPSQNQWRLTYYDPGRSREAVDFILSPEDILDVNSLKRDGASIRNVFRGVYPSSESSVSSPSVSAEFTVEDFGTQEQDHIGNRLPGFLQIYHTSSLGTYGRIFSEIVEEASSMIDTQAEMLRMAEAYLYDLADQQLLYGVETHALPEIDPQDIGKFMENRILHSSDQRLAVTSIRTIVGERASTSIQTRGRPSIGKKRWKAIEARNGNGRPPARTTTESLTELNLRQLSAIRRGLLDRTDQGTGGALLQMRNNAFSEWSSGPKYAPDGWDAIAGSIGTDLLQESTSVRSGNHAIRFVEDTGQLRSYLIPLEGDENTPYTVRWDWLRAIGSAARLDVTMYWFQRDRVTAASTASQLLINVKTGTATSAGWYTSVKEGVEPPSDAAFARIDVQLDLAGDANAEIVLDQISMLRGSRDSRAGFDTGGSATWGLCNTIGDPYNQPWGTTTAGSATHDHGNQLIDDHATAGNNNGYHFLVREPGKYEVTIYAYTTNVHTDDYLWEIVLNGTYDSTNRGQRVTGTVAVDFYQASVAGQADILTAELDLEVGDRISCDLTMLTSLNTIRLSDGASGVSSWRTVKRIAD